MIKTIYLHIGFHKTATTTIQRGLYINKNLLARMGWYYPESGLIWNLAHHNISFELYDDPRFIPAKGGFADLQKEISSCVQENVIISSEDFCFRQEPEIKKLYNRLGELGENIVVIVYIRRQDQWLYSEWSEFTKYPTNTKPFESFIETVGRGDFYQHLKPWAALFGKKNIRVRVLEKSQMEGHVFHDFLHTCDIEELPELSFPEQSNISPNYKTLELIRQFGERYGRAYVPFETDFSFQVGKLIQDYAAKNGWDKARSTVIDRDLHEKIMKRFEESNRMLAKEYLGKDQLFEEPFEDADISKFNFSDMDPGEVLDIMVYVLNELEKSPELLLSSKKVDKLSLLSEKITGKL